MTYCLRGWPTGHACAAPAHGPCPCGPASSRLECGLAGHMHFSVPPLSLLRAICIFESPTRTSRNLANWEGVFSDNPFLYRTSELSRRPHQNLTNPPLSVSHNVAKRHENALRVTNVLKTLTWVSTGHNALGNQTRLPRSNDAALCEAAMLAQAHLRTPMTNVAVKR